MKFASEFDKTEESVNYRAAGLLTGSGLTGTALIAAGIGLGPAGWIAAATVGAVGYYIGDNAYRHEKKRRSELDKVDTPTTFAETEDGFLSRKTGFKALGAMAGVGAGVAACAVLGVATGGVLPIVFLVATTATMLGTGLIGSNIGERIHNGILHHQVDHEANSLKNRKAKADLEDSERAKSPGPTEPGKSYFPDHVQKEPWRIHNPSPPPFSPKDKKADKPGDKPADTEQDKMLAAVRERETARDTLAAEINRRAR